MNARKLLTLALALALVCGLAACSSMGKDGMADQEDSMQSGMMEDQRMCGRGGACMTDSICTDDGMMDEDACMCGEDSKCMTDGMCMDACMCMEDGMCTDQCMCMDGGCMKDDVRRDGCMCGKNDMNGKDMNH